MHIAITGSMGSGKSEVSKILKELMQPVFSADEVVNELYQEDFVKEKLRSLFGSSVLTCNNEVDKAYLSFRIFNHPSERKLVEALIHPLVYQRLFEAAKGLDLAFFEIPLLFESASEEQFDQIVCVITDEENATQRLLQSRSLSLTEIKKRWDHQMSIEEKIRRSDVIIENNGSKNELEEKVIQYLHSLSL